MKKVSLIVIPLIAAALLFAVAVSSEPARLPFSDVPEDAWFYETVSEAYGAGLVKGKSETVFAPRDNVTRAEVAAMLSRLDRADVTEYGKNAEGFSDVRDGSWYREYVGWATSVGILKGYPDGTARPGAEVTRAELSAMIGRYVDGKGAALPADPQTGPFSDASSFGDWFAGAAEDMRISGLIKFKFYPDDFTYSIAEAPEGFLVTLKAKSGAKGSIRQVQALLTRGDYYPKRLRIKVTIFWATITFADFQAGGINDDIFVFPKKRYADYKVIDER